jgi:ribosomal protein L10
VTRVRKEIKELEDGTTVLRNALAVKMFEQTELERKLKQLSDRTYTTTTDGTDRTD